MFVEKSSSSKVEKEPRIVTIIIPKLDQERQKIADTKYSSRQHCVVDGNGCKLKCKMQESFGSFG